MGMASEMRASSSDMSKYTTGMLLVGEVEEIGIDPEPNTSVGEVVLVLCC